MSHYYFGNHHRSRQRFVKGVKAIIITFGVVILIIAIGIVVDVIFLQKQSEQTADSTVETKAVFLPSTQIFRTANFQFQASKSWSFVANESTSSKFIYRSFNKNLVLQELDIYVNVPPLLTEQATRVLPVKIVDNSLQPKQVSAHCKAGMPPAGVQPNPRLIIFDTVQVYCNPSSVDYIVHVGEANDGSTIKLKRPDGSPATYQIFFRDVTFSPDPKELITMMQSFQAR